jgi:hypothetical protein
MGKSAEAPTVTAPPGNKLPMNGVIRRKEQVKETTALPPTIVPVEPGYVGSGIGDGTVQLMPVVSLPTMARYWVCCAGVNGGSPLAA